MTSPTFPGLLLVISGPAGVGKTTITHEVERRLGGVFSVSVTTRARTDADRQGVDYDFVSAEEFQRRREAGEFLEWARVFDHFYGTPRPPVEAAMAGRRLVILEIDVQGAIQIKNNFPGAYAIFVLPPSEAVLLERLRKRKREPEPEIQKRFSKAKQEIALAKASGSYDRFIVNDDLETAIEDAVEAVTAERRRRLDAGAY